MRSSFKVLSSVITAVMMISSFSMLVLADDNSTGYTTPSEEVKGASYEWKLDKDGELSVRNGSTIDLLYMSEENLKKVDSISIEVKKGNSPYMYVSSTSSGEYLCNASSISIKGGLAEGQKRITYVTLKNFPKTNIINSENNIMRFTLNNVGITSLDFVNDSKVTWGISLENCNELKNAVVPSINQVYFNKCEKLESAVITSPKTGFQFLNCESLSSVTLPDGLTTIQYFGFYGCTSLKSIELPDTVKYIQDVTFTNSGIESISIPSEVQIIRERTFKDCKNLMSVYLPSGITIISHDAFSGCDSLTDVYYAGTETQWKSINRGDGSIDDIFGNAKIHFNADSLPGWQKKGNDWFFYNGNGSKVTGWQQISGTWYFFDDKGVMQTGWVESAGKWYYMKDTGAMALGWIQDGGKWYYMSASGAMATGWVQSGDKWYYMGASGAMATGWIQSGKYWYYMSASGAMVTGWQRAGIYWYYFESSGAMKTGWLESGGAKYYLADSGAMVTGKQTIGGKQFEFANDGHCISQ